MFKKEIYEAIVKAKETVAEYQLETDNFDYWDIASKVLLNFRVMKMPILVKQAVLTVCMSAIFTNGNGFMMPSTACCLSNFKSVCKDLKKKKPLYILVYDPDDERSDSNGYFSVRFI